MRTPWRLAAGLERVRLAQAALGTKIPPVYKLNIRFGAGKLIARSDSSADAMRLPVTSKVAKQLGLGKRHTVSPEYPWSKCPVLWITGPVELLESSANTPGIAGHHQKAQQTVFFETDGMLLRRRIHEFRPNERLYLTIRFYGLGPTHNLRLQKEGAFDKAIEGIRAAQLSGFLICAHVVIAGVTDLNEIERLLQYLRTLHIDGVVITAADDSSDATQNKLRAARKLIGNTWWTKFSALVQRALLAPEPDRAAILHSEPSALRASPDLAPDSGLSSEEAAI